MCSSNHITYNHRQIDIHFPEARASANTFIAYSALRLIVLVFDEMIVVERRMVFAKILALGSSSLLADKTVWEDECRSVLSCSPAQVPCN